MKTSMTRIIEGIAACSGALLLASSLHSAVAQEPANLPYLNPQLSAEQRATDLVHRMTLGGKSHADAKQLGRRSPAQGSCASVVE